MRSAAAGNMCRNAPPINEPADNATRGSTSRLILSSGNSMVNAPLRANNAITMPLKMIQVSVFTLGALVTTSAADN